MAKIVLLTPARRFIANRFGLGFQIPLGLVQIGGPLVDAGHEVKLIDNDLYGWKDARLVQEIKQFSADYVLLGHTGSTAAHPICMQTAHALKKSLPHVKLVYGGVFPSYNDQTIMEDFPEIDVIVRGEGERIVTELMVCWTEKLSLATVKGITWRNGTAIVKNPSQAPLVDLDSYRSGWELVDWPKYKLFGMGRSAGIQFSRGCPLTCTYCGQWMFWKKWRHISPEKLVEQLTILAKEYGVKIVWFADENFCADRETLEKVLHLLIEANLDLSLNINMTAADVLRDEDILPLYKKAGIDYVVMGVESLEDEVVTAVRKNNPFEISKSAVHLMRKNKIITLVNIIYGLEEETLSTMRNKFKKICLLDPDILNAVYFTPHFWTQAGKNTNLHEIVQTNQYFWTYRNQIIANPHLSPRALFWGVKITEGLFHLRPKALWRLFFGNDWKIRRILRSSLFVGAKVVVAEIYEFLFKTKFSAKGSYLSDKKGNISAAG